MGNKPGQPEPSPNMLLISCAVQVVSAVTFPSLRGHSCQPPPFWTRARTEAAETTRDTLPLGKFHTIHSLEGHFFVQQVEAVKVRDEAGC